MVQSVIGVKETGSHDSHVMLSLSWLKQNLIYFCMRDQKRKNKNPIYSLFLLNFLMEAYDEPSFNLGIKNASKTKH